MSQLLDQIIALQEARDALVAAQARLNDIPDWMRELHEEHSEQKQEIEALEESAEAAAQERRAAEAEIADTQAKLNRYQEQLNQVTTQREYGALLHEIDTAKAHIAEFEESGFGGLERREEALRALAAKRAEFEDLDNRYGAELAKWEAEKPSVAKEVKRLTRTIEELRKQIPRPFLVQYDRIAARLGGGALAPVLELSTNRKGPRSWHCGTCNFSVRPQIVVTLSTEKTLVLCDSCKRILYLPPPADDEAVE
jgi:predicted  nucleic acid-binding Zn-ribbon protein